MMDRDIRTFLEEDMPRGDITSLAVCRGERIRARIIAKSPCIICGVEEARRVFGYAGVRSVHAEVRDGERLRKGEVVMGVVGDAGAVLGVERTVLNVMTRMSGIATRTRALLDMAKRVNPDVRVAATRKTTPGFRAFEKRAVRVAGGEPHRGSLSEAVLVKDNHIRVAGGIREAVARVRDAMERGSIPVTTIEVEVRSLQEVKEAVGAGVDTIMLDNLPPESVENARRLIPEGITVEVSGGITERNIELYAPYADVVSVGALTHSVQSVDLSMEVTDVESPGCVPSPARAYAPSGWQSHPPGASPPP